MSDFLKDQTSGELAGWLAYLQVDDEVQMQRTTLAMLKASGGGKTQSVSRMVDGEAPIDTTDPKFAKHFQGFIDKPGLRPKRMQSTEIKIG